MEEIRKMRGQIKQKQDLQALVNDLSHYDIADVVGKIGALSLMPENASHAIRLEALAYAAIANSPSANKPRISKGRFRHILKEHLGSSCSISLLEDPCDNMFTEAITFYDGSYVIFPGVMESANFIVRNVCKGLFLSKEHAPHLALRQQALSLVMTFLILSTELAKRANLQRGIKPSREIWNKDIVIPNSQRWTELQRAVTFNKAELLDLLRERPSPEIRDRISPEILDYYVINPGSISDIQDYDPSSSQLFMAPLVDVGEKIIVVVPGLLISAMIHNLSCIALQSDTVSDLTRAFSNALWASAHDSLDLLHNDPLPPPNDLTIPDNLQFHEGFFSLDTDKILYVQLISDDLKDFDQSKPFKTWNNNDLPSLISQRQKYVIEHCFKQVPYLNDILTILLFQTFGRPFSFTLESNDSRYRTPDLALSVADLETIALLDHGDPLVLWKYYKKKTRIREKTIVRSIGELDEFQLYRSHRYSYYVSDDALPTSIHIIPGGAGELRRQAYIESDPHGVIGYLPHTTVEVVHLYSSDVPIYIPEHMLLNPERDAIVVEALPVPIWAIGPEYSTLPDHSPRIFYLPFIDTISYWLWQISSSIQHIIEPMKELTSCLIIEVNLAPSGDWLEIPSDSNNKDSYPSISELVSYNVQAEEYKISLEFSSPIKKLLLHPDNRGERGIIAVLLAAIRELLQKLSIPTAGDLSDDLISKVIDIHAPLGNKKKLIMLPLKDPRLDDRALPRLRKVQHADQQEVLDKVAHYLASASWNAGPISTHSRNELLRAIVDHLYMSLEAAVASLSPSGLLEWLISHNESMNREVSFSQFIVPARLACFYSETEMRKTLAEEIPDLNQAAMASRFLIEYVAACPPKGLRPISLEIYDHLMALSLQIMEYGVISDQLHFHIDDPSLHILPSGRLAVDQESYRRAIEQFLPEYSAGSIRKAKESFAGAWQLPKIDLHSQTEFDIHFDRAFIAEFGYSTEQFGKMCGEAVNIGYTQLGSMKSMSIAEFIRSISSGTGISESIVTTFMNQLMLEPRDDFIKPVPDFRSEDVYPWRFNRALSYIRRPLIKFREHDEDKVAWGNRHLVHSMFYLQNLCFAGKLKAQSRDMKEFMSRMRNEETKAFNDEVNDIFAAVPEVITRKRIDKFSGIPMVDQKGYLGDIDVLVASRPKRQILLIECKDLSPASVPHELSNELAKLLVDDKQDCAVTLLRRRAKWVEDNIDLVSKEIGVEDSDWKVSPLVIVSRDLMTPYMRNVPVKTYSLRQITESFLPKWSSNQTA